MVKNIVLLLSLVLSVSVNAQCTFLDQLSPYQRDVAYQVYRAGQAYDLELTSVAIAWQESRLGLYKARYGVGKDISFGIMHTAVYWKTKNMTAFERGRWVQSMIQDDAKSIQVGVSDILYWQNRAKNNWSLGVMMYNTGGGANAKYLNEVISVVRELKKCEW